MNDLQRAILYVAIATVVLYLSVVALAVFVFVDTTNRTAQNRERIGDIQRSRVESCERSYEGIREVFRPLFPRSDDPATPRNELNDLATFNRTIDRLKAGCAQQISTKGA